MTGPEVSFKIALLAAAGVSEHEMTSIQRALAASKKRATLISPDSGLIHSWGDGIWGHCYPVDAKLETSLGSDFDMLILPGGERHITKLMANPHTRRFVSAFFMMNKPVAAFSDAHTVLTTNTLEGDNALMLSYASTDELVDACKTMIEHFDAYVPQDEEIAHAA